MSNAILLIILPSLAYHSPVYANEGNLYDSNAYVDDPTEKRFVSIENELYNLKKYVDESSRVSADERKIIEDTMWENTKFIRERIDKVNVKVISSAKESDILSLRDMLTRSVIDLKSEIWDQFVSSQQVLDAQYNQKLNATKSELQSVRNDYESMKNALIYSAIGIAILAIAVPGVVYLILDRKAKRGRIFSPH